MMQFEFLFRIFVFITLFINAFCQNQPVADKKELPKPKEFSLDSIQNSGFGSNGLSHALGLSFSNNGKYQFTYGSEGIYWHNEGTYKIEEDKVLLNALVCKEREDDKDSIKCKNTFGNGYCKVEDPKWNYFFRKVLACYSKGNSDPFGLILDPTNRFEFPIPELRIQTGEKIVLYGTPAISMRDELALTTSDVKIREKPNINSKSYPYFEDLYLASLPYVPKNTEIILQARTIEKEKIKNWENYWYYITVKKNNFSGWMFGEFIQVKSN